MGNVGFEGGGGFRRGRLGTEKIGVGDGEGWRVLETEKIGVFDGGCGGG